MNNSRNVYYISYTGVLTGSQELRDYNANLANGDMYKGTLTKFGEYCKLYDTIGSKKAEPFFDSIAAQIALLNKSVFDTSFNYLPVTLETTKDSNKNLINRNLNMFTTGSGIQFKLIKDDSKVSSPRFVNYESGKHVFIFGPISRDTYAKISILANRATSTVPLFIHMQGENGVYNKINSKNSNSSNLIGMKKKDGVFANAFNFQGNMYNANRFRNHMKRVAQCYTVCLKNEARSANGTLPPIMKKFYDNIITKYIKGTNNKANSTNNSISLDIAYITQDIYDKDNFVSLDQLLKKSKSTPVIEITGKAYFTKTGSNVRNAMSIPFANGKPRLGFKGKFNSGFNMLGGQNNSNNKGVSTGWQYNKNLTNHINSFIVSCWKMCGLLPTLPKPKVVFMDQISIYEPTVPKPIGFHENMFVNAYGFWNQAVNGVYITKKNLFSKYTSQNNSRKN
jgi:hypothetical protein